MPAVDRLRLIGSPDTNKVMMGELSRLARRSLKRRPPTPRKFPRAGLLYPFDPDLAVLAVRYQRTVTRALWELFESRTRRLEPLYDDLRLAIAEQTRTWCWDGAGISVRARNVSEFAAGERQVVGTVKNALIDGAAELGCTLYVQRERPDLLVDVRMHDRTLTVSLDLGGRSLSQRGYRQDSGPAPLREHLAAVLCMLVRHNPRSQIFLDPMCGSGTICIESALMATAAPRANQPTADAPLYSRLPAFESIVGPATDQPEPLFADTRPLVIGNDHERRVLQTATANARRAGVSGVSLWHCGDFRDLTLERIKTWAAAQNWQGDDRGVIVCNPPYGHRLSDRELIDLYCDLGDWCAQFRGWRAAFLTANDAWADAFGHRYQIQKSLKNGPLRATLYIYDF